MAKKEILFIEKIINWSENFWHAIGDWYYGADRDITADLGGYIIIPYGDAAETEREYDEVLQCFCTEKNLYEYEEEFPNGQDVAVIRLYICSNDYAVAVVTVR